MRFRKLIPFFLMVALTLMICITGIAAPKIYRVAFIMKTLTNPFFITMEHGGKKAAAELKNIHLLIQVAAEETSIEEQIAITEDMIAKKVDAICIAPSGSKEIVPVLVKAQKAKIVLIDMDVMVDQDAAQANGLNPVPYVGADNFQGGYMAGQWLVKVLGGKGKVAILEGIPGVDNGEKRKNGAIKAFKEAPGIKLVSSQTAHWKTEEALNVFTNILQAHPDLDGVFCANDMMAFGAIQAIEAAGKNNKIKVASYDALEAAKEAIKTGTMGCSVDQRPDLMGYHSVKFALAAIQGKKVPGIYMVPLKLVTKENVK